MAKANISTSEARAEIKALAAEIKFLERGIKTLSKTTKTSFDTVETSVQKLKASTIKLNNNFKTLNSTVKKQQASIKKLTAAQKNNSSAMAKSSNQAGALGKAYRLIGYSGLILLAKQYGKQIFNQIKTFNSLDFAIKNVIKTTIEYTQTYVFLNQLTEDFGATMENTANRWLKFRTAAEQSGLSLKDSQDIFRSMTKASAVLGLKTDELRGIYLALEQMLSKGKVTTEELRRQLGERLPGAMGIMAKSMGVTIPKLDEMLKKGEVMSAVVLPNFAKEMERAFGIENINRVENLQASVGRLRGTWDSFMSTLSRSKTTFGKTVNGAINDIQRLLKVINVLAADPIIEVELKMVSEQRKQEVYFEDAAKKRLKIEKGIINDLEEYNKELARVKKEIAKEEIEELREKVAEEEKLLLNAQSNLDEIKSSMNILKRTFGPLFDNDGMIKYLRDTEALEGSIDRLIAKLAESKSKLSIRELILGESEVETEGSENGPIKLAKKEADLEYQILISRLKFRIAWNKDLIESDKTALKEKEDLYLENLGFQKQLADLEYQNKIENIKIWAENSKNVNRNSNKDEQQKAVRNIEINKKLNQTLELEKENHLNKIFALEIKYESNSEKLKINEHNLNLKLIQEEYDKKSILAKKEYELSSKNQSDKIKLEKALSKIKFEATNSIIDSEIAYRNNLLNTLDLSSDAIKEIKAQITKLENSRPLSPDEFLDEKEWNDRILRILDLLSEFNQAIGDIFDNAFQQRIDNIDAEIRAEERKYDKLITLAEDNEEQRKTIERNRELRIQELERKRIREERKQAIARKAFATSDIAITTAQNVVAAYAPPPIGLGPLGGSALASLMIALGAFQTAAVIAEPLPAYAEGGISPRDEKALINDAGVQEFVERNGSILTTDTSNAVVNLKKNDVIYKDFDELMRKSMILSVLNNGEDNDKLEKYFSGIEGAVLKGFSKAKINNSIKLNEVNNSYSEKIRSW